MPVLPSLLFNAGFLPKPRSNFSNPFDRYILELLLRRLQIRYIIFGLTWKPHYLACRDVPSIWTFWSASTEGAKFIFHAALNVSHWRNATTALRFREDSLEASTKMTSAGRDGVSLSRNCVVTPSWTRGLRSRRTWYSAQLL